MTIPMTVFTISRLNQAVRQLLENEMGQIWLSGEISNFSQPSSGHWYFTLKDDHAQVRCAMFRNSNRRVSLQPQNGQQVLVRASVTLYEPRGDYQLIIESMQAAGDGLLQQQFEQLKQKLSQAGLFDQQHKQPLPQPVRCVGIVTSPTGAALYDILHILQRRDPSLPVVIYPTMVQGSDAAAQIKRAVELANQRNECDVLIVGRGGGSLEDLWCFNDEQLAYAIYHSQIPIVSAVGHEVDVTIADFVADVRAPTPSAAAELVSRDQQELLRRLNSARQRLDMAMDYYLVHKNQQLTRLVHRLQQQHPHLYLARQQTRLLQLQRHLTDELQLILQRSRLQQEKYHYRLLHAQPENMIHRYQQLLQQLQHRLQQSVERQLNSGKQQFGQLCSHLSAVSPLATLARGYSITETASGKVLQQVSDVQAGDMLKTRLQDGWLMSSVQSVATNNQ